MQTSFQKSSQHTSEQLTRAIIQKKGQIEIVSNGTSMYPFIKEGNVCRFEKVNLSTLSKGDIVLFSVDGVLIGHRFYQCIEQDNEKFYILKGDNNFIPDKPIKKEQILGRLVFVKKQKRIIHAYGFVAKLWGYVVCQFPYTVHSIRNYLRIKNKMNKLFRMGV